ncbi:MAG: hypothetical protein R2729_18075 [Bryobacteraceae bacterium]
MNRSKAHQWLACALMFGTAAVANAGPLRLEPGLASVRFYEQSGAVSTFNFGVNSTELATQLGGNLSSTNSDFIGVPNEFYDVFYSDANGAFNMNGEFVTIEGNYTGGGSGFNISEVELVFGGSTRFATSLESYVPGSSAFLMANLANILDGNVNTSTAMGQLASPDRMRVTVGFAPLSATPEPSTYLTGAAGLALLALLRRQAV